MEKKQTLDIKQKQANKNQKFKINSAKSANRAEDYEFFPSFRFVNCIIPFL